MAAPAARYSGVAMALHWLTALCATLALAGGALTGTAGGAAAAALAAVHLWAGGAALALTLASLAWRLGHPPPPLPAWMTRWERRAAALAHLGFWLLLLVLPLSGWAIRPAGPLAREAHALAAGLLAALLALHVAAVLKHRWMDRADLLARILPRR